jgi:hypothetical protein
MIDDIFALNDDFSFLSWWQKVIVLRQNGDFDAKTLANRAWTPFFRRQGIGGNLVRGLGHAIGFKDWTAKP